MMLRATRLGARLPRANAPLCARACSTAVRRIEPDPPPPEPAASSRGGRASPVLRAITAALAPAGERVDVPDHEAKALDGLYDALMEPLPSPPSQAERLNALRATDTREDAFLRRNGRTVGQHAHLVRCLGVQGEVERAHRAFDRIAQMGKTPDNRAYAALIDACARAGDVPRAEAVIARMEEAGTPARADVWTGRCAVVVVAVAVEA